MHRQTDRAVGTSRIATRGLSGAMIGSFCLHGLVIALVIGAMSPKGAALDEGAAVTIVIDPSAPSIASTGIVPSSAPAAEAQAAASPERETAAAERANPEPRALEDSIPPPVQETLAVPDLHPPPPRSKEVPAAMPVMPPSRGAEVPRAPEPPPAPTPPVAAPQDSVPPPNQEALAAPDLRPVAPPNEEPVARLENAVPSPSPERLAVPEFRPAPNPIKPTAQKPIVTPRPEGPRPPAAATARPESSRPSAATQRDAPAMGAGNRDSASAAPAASSLAPQASTASPQAAIAPNWNALLSAWLAANRRYPEASRRRGEEGEVTVRFTVAPNGRVLDAALVKSSGFPGLDASALAMLRDATLPAPGVEATRSVRVRYRLND